MAVLFNSFSGGCCGSGSLDAYTQAAWSADQTSYQPPAGYSLVFISSTTAVKVYGLDLAAGRMVLLRNVGTFPITFVDESSSASSTTMRLDNPDNLSFVLEPGATATYRADASSATTPRVRLLDTTASVGSVLVQPGGTLALGTSVTTAAVEGGTTSFAEVIRDDGSAAMLALLRSGGTAGTGSSMLFARSRGTESAQTAIVTGDTIASLTFLGFDGTDYATAARLLVQATGTVGANTMPGRWVFQTSPAGSQTPADRLAIESDGGLTVGIDGYLSFDQHSGTPATPAAGRTVVYVDANGVLRTLSSAGASAPVASTWTLYTKTYADLSAAATTNTITLATLAAKTVLDEVAIWPSVAFGGGGITTYAAAILHGGNAVVTGFNLMNAGGSNLAHKKDVPNYCTVLSMTATAALQLKVDCTGGNLSAATAGVVNVWVRTTVLP